MCLVIECDVNYYFECFYRVLVVVNIVLYLEYYR